MRYLLWFGLFCVFTTSCTKDHQFTTDPTSKLSFSTDSVLFDTVFTSIGSITRKIKVFNNNQKAVKISEIKLAGGSLSSFQLNINGKQASQQNDIELDGMDSMFVFVKASINPNSSNLPFIVEDSISFITNGNIQKVQLAAYGQNARFVNDLNITTNTVWDNSLPYVIYNTARVNRNIKLTIGSGTRLYFHKNAKLLVAGTLEVNGTSTDSVTFTSDRRERIYENEPGQWNGISFLGSSKDNIIKNATIKNAITGIEIDSASVNASPKLILANSIIKNIQIAGLISKAATIRLFNNLFYNCGQYLVYGVGGGDLDFKQNTFAAYNFNFSRQTPALFFSDNISSTSSPIKTSPLRLNLSNNLIWGSLDDEIIIEQKGTSTINFTSSTNLIKTKNQAFNISGNLLNTEPQFNNPKFELYQLNSNSPGINKGVSLISDLYYVQYLSKDIKEKLRSFPSELGCYEF